MSISSLTMRILAVVAMFQLAVSFQPLTSARKTTTALSAWSLPLPNGDFGFKTSWYNEYKNPTAQSVVYNDTPTDYSFVLLGKDWPSYDDVTAEDDQSNMQTASVAQPKRNPLRRAAQWARRQTNKN